MRLHGMAYWRERVRRSQSFGAPSEPVAFDPNSLNQVVYRLSQTPDGRAFFDWLYTFAHEDLPSEDRGAERALLQLTERKILVNRIFALIKAGEERLHDGIDGNYGND